MSSGKQEEKFYALQSDEVQRVPEMLRSMSFYALILYGLAFILIDYKEPTPGHGYRVN